MQYHSAIPDENWKCRFSPATFPPYLFECLGENAQKKDISILVSAHKASWILKKYYRGFFLTEHKEKLNFFQLSDFPRNFKVYFILNSAMHIEYKFAAEWSNPLLLNVIVTKNPYNYERKIAIWRGKKRKIW